MKTVHKVITDYEIQKINVPNKSLAVHIRSILDSAGFKFKDNGKPIGNFKTWYDIEKDATHYEQTYED